MVPYIDSKGVTWILDPPGSTVLDVDGKSVTVQQWTARITSDAYNYKAGQTLVIGDDADVVRANIDDFVIAPQVKRQDAPGARERLAAGGGGDWLWLLALAFLILDEKGRKR